MYESKIDATIYDDTNLKEQVSGLTFVNKTSVILSWRNNINFLYIKTNDKVVKNSKGRINL